MPSPHFPALCTRLKDSTWWSQMSLQQPRLYENTALCRTTCPMGRPQQCCLGRLKGWLHKHTHPGDFPGGPVVKSPPSSAGDKCSIPGQGTKIPHATGHLSPRDTIREPVCSRACTSRKQKLANRESLFTAMKTQHKKFFKYKIKNLKGN